VGSWGNGATLDTPSFRGRIRGKQTAPRNGAIGDAVKTPNRIKNAKLAKVPIWDYHLFMRIIALSTLKTFWEDSPEDIDAKEPTLAWYRHALNADWRSPSDVKQDFRNASILKDGRVVFNIAGNKYRLVVWINYAYKVVYIRFIGSHAQYDKIDVQTI
jgi:mRNA interferase HigB